MPFIMETDVQDILVDLVADFSSISYAGTFDGSVLVAFAKRLELSSGMTSNLNKRVFKIFVELGQNIALYSIDKLATERDITFKGNGIFIVREYNDRFRLYAGNLATSSDADVAFEKCEKIKSMSYDKLREYKRELRRKPSKQGGGNIGLVQIVLTAKNNIDCQLIDVDNQKKFVVFSVDILK